MGRKAKGEDAPFSEGAFYSNLSVVCLYNPIYHGKTKTGVLAFGSRRICLIKTLPYMREIVFADTDSIIFHRTFDQVRRFGILLKGKLNVPVFFSVGYRIVQKIHKKTDEEGFVSDHIELRRNLILHDNLLFRSIFFCFFAKAEAHLVQKDLMARV